MSQAFEALGLSSDLAATLSTLGFEQPTEIQQQAIPDVLSGRDVLAGAQTGTGKTAAFGLPIIQKLRDRAKEEKRKPAALIVVPTRELALQVSENLTQYAEGTELSIVTVYGGASFHVQKQALRSGCDVLIATTGRLLDHLFNRTTDLSQVEYLVFDEADRMLDMGFMPDIQRIMKRMPEHYQMMLFSATFEQRIKTLAYRLMNDPVEIQVTPANSTADTVKQIVYPVDKKRKRELLSYLIGSRNWQQVLVFTKTKQGSDALVKEMKLDGIKAVSINGDKSQGARQRALEQFKTGEVRALIATDVAARGIDVNALEHVVNYDMPYKAEDYIHRIGRAGRAGKQGFAVSLMSRDEEYLLEAIENLLGDRLPQEWLQGFEPSLVEEVEEERPTQRRRRRGDDKRKMKAKLKIHQNRGKKKSGR